MFFFQLFLLLLLFFIIFNLQSFFSFNFAFFIWCLRLDILPDFHKINSIINKISSQSSTQSSIEYYDIRFQKIKRRLATLNNDNSINIKTEVEKGIGARFLINGKWGFSSSTVPDFNDYNSISAIVHQAQLLGSIKVSSASDRVILAPDDRIYTTTVNLPSKKQELLSTEELTDYLKNLKYHLNPTELNVTINTKLEQIISSFISSNGSMIHQNQLRNISNFKAQQNFLSLSTTTGSLGNVGEETIDLNLIEGLELLNQDFNSFLKASIPPSGSFTVMLSPQATWTVIHESLGHAIEGDTVVEGKSLITPDKLGQKIASECVTVIDDPTIPTVGSFAYDDDGIKAAGKIIIEEGMFSDFLHNRESAGAVNSITTGNSKAKNYSFFPLVRMSNFYLESGNTSIEELKNFTGIYIEKCGSGISQPYSGEFRVPVILGYEIRCGDIIRPLRNFFIVENMLNFLSNISLVSSKSEYHINECGKRGQSVYQGSISPFTRVDNVQIRGK